jgi:cell division protein FtsL
MRTQLQQKETEEKRLGRIIGWFAAIALVLLLLVLVLVLVLVVGSVVAKRAAQSGTWPKPLSSTVVN